jgi:thymidylate synthase (FAD)
MAHPVLPRSFHIACNQVEWEPDLSQAEPDLLAEFAGRLCYKSWRAYDGTDATNANVTKVREGNREYLANIIKSRHGSVFEHLSFTFLFQGCTRVLTHELVRHRAGMAYSQESLRYVRLENLQIHVPDFDKLPDAAKAVFRRSELQARVAVQTLNELLLQNDMSFAEMKKFTSMIRRICPIGVKTNIMFTANIRALRHIIVLRTSEDAEVEIREAFDTIKRICLSEAPNCFQLLDECPKI